MCFAKLWVARHCSHGNLNYDNKRDDNKKHEYAPASILVNHDFVWL